MVRFPMLFFPPAGPAHIQKNCCEQMRSVLRTIVFGDHFSDLSAAVESGLCPASFIGADGMSDKQAALLRLRLELVLPNPRKILNWALEVGMKLFSLNHIFRAGTHSTGSSTDSHDLIFFWC